MKYGAGVELYRYPELPERPTSESVRVAQLVLLAGRLPSLLQCPKSTGGTTALASQEGREEKSPVASFFSSR